MIIRGRFPAYGAVVLLLTIVSTAQAKYSGGTGEPNDPYQIATAADLIALGETPEDYDKHFILTADIDLDPNLPGGRVFDRAVIAADTNDVEDGFQGTPFTGVFDGNGHTISHLTLKGAGYLGFCGQLSSGAKVTALGMVDVNTVGSGLHIGGLVGVSYSSTVNQCYSTGTINGRSYVGGLIGDNSGSVIQCYSTVAMSGIGGHVGGLIGENGWHGRIADCYSTGAVSGLNGVGGLVGSNGASLTRCYSTGAVDGNDGVGGLVGIGYSPAPGPGYLHGSATDCFWDVQTSGQATSVGGTGKTTAEMQSAATFFRWAICGNEGIWTIDEGNDHPRLWWEHLPGKAIRFANLSDLLLGTGSGNDPFLIETPEELNTIGLYPCEWDKHFKLMADIDLSGFDGKDGRPSFNIIGDDYRESGSYGDPPPVGRAFTGVFDGNGHTISHLTVRSQPGCGGLFAGLGGQVEDLGVVDVNVTSASYGAVGALVGYNSSGVLTRCYSAGVVSGSDTVGGLVGYNLGTVTQCYSVCAVNGDSSVGGLVGVNFGTVTQCYSTGGVNGTDSVGGLVGCGHVDLGLVDGTCCKWLSGVVLSSFWDIQTSGQASSAGGTGLTTAEMQTAGTFLEAGWDFVGETENGTHEVWQMPERSSCPGLAVFGGYTPPQLRGLGTEENPYLVSDPIELGAMIYYSHNAHYRLKTAIDLSGIHWATAVIPFFTGTFDGNGLTLSHLTIRGGGLLGVFGRLDSGATVRDLGIVEVNIVGSGKAVAGVAAVNSNGGHMIRCYSTGAVTTCGSYGHFSSSAESYVGGLVGQNEGVVSECHSATAISGTGTNVAGLVGRNMGSITDCYSTGTVSAPAYFVGGLVGYNYGAMTRCYSTGAVSGWLGGGLLGQNYATVSACFWDTETSGQATSDGGTGKTTAEMQTAATFLDAGWDLVGETANGTEDIWWILEGKDYPRLW